jgi:thymidylate synthase
MFQILEANCANEAWQRVARWFAPDGFAVPQSGRGGETTEVLHVGISIRNSRQRWIAARSPAMNPAFAIAEVIWIITGRNDSGFLTYFNRSLPIYAGKAETLHGAYGFRLRRHFGVDQFELAYRALTAQADSRQIVLQIWDPRNDAPDPRGCPSAEDIPCNVVAFLKVRDGRLEWTQIMRSNDLFLGLPHNIIQFTSLQEVFAGWLGLEPGTYNHFSDSLHLYARDGSISELVRPTDLPDNSDSLALAKSESEQVFSHLSKFGDLLINESNGAADIRDALSHLEIPEPYINLAKILTAEALRRRKQFDLARETAAASSNRCLQFMFERWLERVLAEKSEL